MLCLSQPLTTWLPRFHVSHLTSLKRGASSWNSDESDWGSYGYRSEHRGVTPQACRSLEIGVHHNEMPELAAVSDDALIEKVVKAQDDRLFYVSEAIRRG